ncbi:aminotransferase class I/II-fold pyridoxal phosphate-dependent enzyme [Corynebacterium liangguodongii]|uniref:8-amino-7-oxononanoate synthase n=1 Tax=Corynebacterium liangguodongii TaxID=2079535 RepID=A0A2S0WEN5_9CORY|nr:8-amino-7-oxononanoate synthase [Corynebacterium liangguodongii]AWB84194.1 8-amino-7-oxononanoate synthase [Corynebacterium liangguodongii]PWC00204.1 8-amino-7-oxononanoate synthase [Corynebacterium liangguodongii]
MAWLEDFSDDTLDTWRAAGLERFPATFSTAQLPTSTIDGREMVLFSSSNYLGLAEHPRVVAAAVRATRTLGAGSGGSRLTTGTTIAHLAAEADFARFLGYPSAVLYSSGFAANTGVLQALAGPGTLILSDALNHASLIDGCRLAKASGAEVKVYPNRDVAAVDDALQAHPTRRCLVVTDGVFSMDGTLAPLQELTRVCRAHGAALMVDDAHGTGTVGESGRGIVEHFRMEEDAPDILVATASKALGAEGAVVATSEGVAHVLRQRSRPYVFSTSPAPATCAAISEALEIVSGPESPVAALHDNVERLAERLGWGGWDSPILPVPVGDESRAMEASAALKEAEFFVPAIRWPTVPRGRAILRVTVMATHTPEQIDALAGALGALA